MDKKINLRQIAFLNRQPTLFSHGCPAMKIIPSDDEAPVIYVSPFSIEMMNMDFDGDSIVSSIVTISKNKFKIHEIEDFNKIYNCEQYEIKTTKSGKVITKYKVLDDVEVPAIDIQTGKIQNKKVTEFSIHENLSMWSIIKKKKNSNMPFFKTIEVSSDHSLVVFDKEQQIIKRESVLNIKENPERYFFIKNTRNKIPRNNEKTLFLNSKINHSESGYFIGAFMGDGHVCQSDNSIYLSNTDKNIGNYWKNCLQKLIDLYPTKENQKVQFVPSKNREKNETNYSDQTCQRWRVKNKIISDEIKKYFGSEEIINSQTKILPVNIFGNNDNFFKGFMAGYIDTDGSINKTKCVLSSKSKQLLENIQQILDNVYKISCSLNSTIRKKHDKETQYWILDIGISQSLSFFKTLLPLMKSEIKINNLKKVINQYSNINDDWICYIPEKIINNLILNKKIKSIQHGIKIKKNGYTAKFIKIDEQLIKNESEIIQELIKKQNNKEIQFIPCSYFEFNKSEKTTAYDLTVKDFYTFITSDGLFVWDTGAIYLLHDEKSLRETYQNAFYGNVLKYDANDNMLATIRHEALYAAYVLTAHLSDDFVIDKENILFDIKNLKELEENINLFNNNLESTVKINNDLYTYGSCLLNKWMGADKVYLNRIITKSQIQEISKSIYYNVVNKDSIEFYNKIFDLGKKLMFFISITNHAPSIDVEEMSSLVDEPTRELFSKLPKENAYICFQLNEGLINKCLNNFSHESKLYKLFRSGSRFSKSQLARSCINIGLVADDQNIINQHPITSSLIEGLTPDEFFRSAPGTRKGLADKANMTPTSGYMTRTLVMGMGTITINEDDCGCTTGLIIPVMDMRHLKSLAGKWFKINESEDWKLIDDINKFKNLIGEEIILRSPMTCKTSDFKVCKKCFGEKKTRTQYIGIVAAQCATERLTQLIMRVFHTSGSAELKKNNNIMNFVENYLVDIEEINDEYHIKFSKKIECESDFKEIIGFKKFTNKKTEVIYEKIKTPVKNNDTVAIVNKIKDILKKETSVKKTPSEYYIEMMDQLLSVGSIYSSYIELMLAHMFITDIEKNKFWRYNQNEPVMVKISDKTMASKISPLLGFLYQPNKKTVNDVDLEYFEELIENTDSLSTDKLSIHERIFLEKI